METESKTPPPISATSSVEQWYIPPSPVPRLPGNEVPVLVDEEDEEVIETPSAEESVPDDHKQEQPTDTSEVDEETLRWFAYYGAPGSITSPEPKVPSRQRGAKPALHSSSSRCQGYSSSKSPSTSVWQPRLGAFRRSAPKEEEDEISKHEFLKGKDLHDPDWWKTLYPPLKDFAPQTNPIPPNVSRNVDNKSANDNIWIHLFEAGIDTEKRKLFHAGPQSFREMSKMWVGFKSMDEESREVTVPTMTQVRCWDRTLRSTRSVTPPLPKRKGKAGGKKPTGQSSSKPLRATTPQGASTTGRTQNKSPWYQRRENEMRKESAMYLKSSSVHLDQLRRQQEAGNM